MALGRGFEIGDHEGHLRRRQMVSGAEWKNRFQNSTVAEVQAHMKRWGVIGADYSVVDANLATMGPAMATSNFDTSKDTAFFFMIPKSGTTTLGAYLANCVTERLVIANAVGGFVETFPPTSLKVVDHKGNKYVNVDVTTRDGLDWAADNGIAQSAIADVLISAFPVHVANVFSAENQAHIVEINEHGITVAKDKGIPGDENHEQNSARFKTGANSASPNANSYEKANDKIKKETMLQKLQKGDSAGHNAERSNA